MHLARAGREGTHVLQDFERERREEVAADPSVGRDLADCYASQCIRATLEQHRSGSAALAGAAGDL